MRGESKNFQVFGSFASLRLGGPFLISHTGRKLWDFTGERERLTPSLTWAADVCAQAITENFTDEKQSTSAA